MKKNTHTHKHSDLNVVTSDNFPQNMANFANIIPKKHSASDKILPKKNNGPNHLTIIPFYKLLVFLL